MPRSDVLHQQTAQNRLQRALASQRVPHAYLFTGPTGVGKEMLAARLAQLLLCGGQGVVNAHEQGPLPYGRGSDFSDACGLCTDCTLFAAGNHPDFHRIHRTLNKLHPDKKVRDRKAVDLSIDVIRHFVLDRIMLKPSRERAKVFLIVESDRLSIQAQNALLKTLEEPPGHSYLILLAASPDQLLPTTRSRCQQIPFGTLPDSFVHEQLVARHRIPAEQAALLTQLAQGSVGLALRYAEMGVHNHLGEVQSAVQTAAADPLAAGKALADLAKELSSDADAVEDEDNVDTNAAREAQSLVIAIAAMILRDVQRAMIGSAPVALPNWAGIGELSRKLSRPGTGQAIKALGLAEYQIDQNANTGLIFDSVGIAIGRAFGQPVALTR